MKKVESNKNKIALKKMIKRPKRSSDLFKNSDYFRKEFSFGPFLAATFTAIFIGLFLGLMMLNMFAKKEDIANYNDQQSSAIPEDEDAMEHAENNVMSTSLKQMSAFVIQLGVFSERENADTWSKTYEQTGFPSTLFKRDDQYFLFIGMANTEEKAKEFAEVLLEQDIEVYVKEWKTNEIDIKLTEEESKWIQLFQELWQTTLSSLSQQEGMLLGDWEELIKKHPKNSDLITAFVSEIQSIFENRPEKQTSFLLQNDLLNIWKSYEEIFILK